MSSIAGNISAEIDEKLTLTQPRMFRPQLKSADEEDVSLDETQLETGDVRGQAAVSSYQM